MLDSNEDFKEADFAKVVNVFPLLYKMFHIQDILICASFPSIVHFHLPRLLSTRHIAISFLLSE